MNFYERLFKIQFLGCFDNYKLHAQSDFESFDYYQLFDHLLKSHKAFYGLEQKLEESHL